ncbi:MAG: ATP-binding protein [Crocinitomicaceae bacterium]|nr:ATP-binding protein [Crocinitomicaceae bacterium]
MIPFKYGKVIESSYFVNREKEIAFLQRNFKSKINTVLISPRRWGKSSLVKYAATSLASSDKKIVPVFIDLFNVRDEKEFYETFSRKILMATYTKLEERINAVKLLFRLVTPKISVGVDPNTEFSLGFDIHEIKKNPDEILNLPERISKLKKIELVICVDEFQNIAYFSNPLAFQKKLRAQWQHHQHAVYCLYGSKRNMLAELFENKSMPFYKFGDVFFLQKIDTPHWQKYLLRQFKKTKKEIHADAVEKIITTMENHPYFVQQLAAMSWENTTKSCSVKIVDQSIDELLVTHDLLFHRETDLLSNYQIRFLRALVNVVKQFSTAETIRMYDLGSSANVVRVRKALVDKEMIDIYGKTIEFMDPLYKQWMKRVYMNRFNYI